MKKLLLIICFIIPGILKAQNTHTLESDTNPLTTFQLRYKTVTPDSLNHLWIFWNNKYNRLVTMTEADLKYAPASGGGYVASVSGTTNRITSTGGANPVLNISSAFEALIVPYSGAIHDVDLVSTGKGIYAEFAEIGHGSSTGAGKWGAIIYNNDLAGNGVLLLQTSDNTSGRVSFHQEDPLGTTYIAFKNDGSGVFASTLAASNFIGSGAGLTGSGTGFTSGNSTLWNSQSITLSALAANDIMQYDGSTWRNVVNTFSSPLHRSGGNTSIDNAAADGTTKGAASFTANDFDATSGNISIDYTNGQAASASNKGFLVAADWSTFNSKQTALSGTGILSFSGTTPSYNTTSASIAGLISDETGSGAMVFGTSPNLVTPNIGVANGTSLNLITSSPPATPASGMTMWASAGSRIDFQTSSGFDMRLSFNVTTASRTYLFNDSGGVIYSTNSTAAGMIPYAIGTVTTAGLPIGSTDDVLTVASGLPAWINFNTATRTLTNKNLTSGTNTFPVFADANISSATNWNLAYAQIPIAGSFSGVGTATTTFTVTIGTTQANTTYKVNATPTDLLAAAVFYITNKTTTTFDVVYLAGLTGTVTFDWAVFK